MAQPPAYSLSFSFTNYTANYPSRQQPGVSLDTEFRNIKTTLDAIRTNIALIQRDDGALRNEVVTADSISSELTMGLRSIDDWATATAYIENDAVWYQYKLYRCSVSHTSTASFATDLAVPKWTLILDLTTYAADAAEAAVTAEVLAGIELDVDLGPINTALAGKASLADANTFLNTQSIAGLVTLLAGALAQVNTATTLATYFEGRPTDYGAGKPKLLIRKSATAGTWEIALDDGAAGTTTLNLVATNVQKNGSALLTAAEVDNTALETSIRRNKVFALSALAA